MNNREQLIEFIATYGLERREIAELVKVDRGTVDAWLLSPEAGRYEEMPDMAIELLRLKLAAREDGAPG